MPAIPGQRGAHGGAAVLRCYLEHLELLISEAECRGDLDRPERLAESIEEYRDFLLALDDDIERGPSASPPQRGADRE